MENIQQLAEQSSIRYLGTKNPNYIEGYVKGYKEAEQTFQEWKKE